VNQGPCSAVLREINMLLSPPLNKPTADFLPEITSGRSGTIDLINGQLQRLDSHCRTSIHSRKEDKHLQNMSQITGLHISFSLLFDSRGKPKQRSGWTQLA